MLLALLLAFGVGFSSPAEDPNLAGQYYVRVWGADDGFTEGSVTDVAQTPEGYLWVGTLFGSVVRFDGIRFVSYTSANTPGFSSKWGVPRLMVDATGMLWINMYDGGMTLWDRRGFRPAFTMTNQPDHMLWSAPGKILFVYGDGRLLSGKERGGRWNWDIVTLTNATGQSQHCVDARGRVWYLRGDQEIGVWNGDTTELRWTAADQRVKALAADPQGNIWAGTDKALMQWQTDHFEPMNPTNGESVLNIKRLVPSANCLWVEANGQMRRCAGRQWLATSEGWKQELGRFNSLRFIHGDNEGGLWTSSGDLGLVHILDDGTLHRITTRDGLPSDIVHFAFQDRDGNTWTGYERGGLVQIRQRLFKTISKAQGLDDSLVNTVCQDSNGAVWIGTHSGKVSVFANSICTNLDLTLLGNARLQDSGIAADGGGRVWIGGQGFGLLKYEAGNLAQVSAPSQFYIEPWRQAYPRLLLPARDGRLWLGTLWSILSVSNQVVTKEYEAATPGEHPTSLAEAVDGSIWAGTLAGNLLHWDGKQFLPVEPPDRDSLGRIWALWAAPDGSLWAGTEEGGLLHWQHGTFRRYTMRDGLPSDSIIQIVGDAQGNLWLGTRAGIVRISAAAFNLFESAKITELPVSVYGQSDGLLTIGSAIISQPNCWRGNDGILLFAMANSVAIANPAKVHVNPTPPIATLEELRANEKIIWPTRSGAILTAPVLANTSDTQEPPYLINVGPGRGDLEFQFAGPNLGSPQRVRFKYKLEGLENSWNEAGTERKAVYRHVPPGQYVFHVTACNSDSVWSSDSALAAVTIAPFFYQTLWFQGAAGILAIGGLSLALVSAARRRMRHRLEQLEHQHELERERTRIAQDLHDELGAGLTEIGLIGGLLQKTPAGSERSRHGLDRIAQRCRDLVTALDEIVWAVNPRNDSMNSLGSYLARYAQEFFESTSIRCRLSVQEMDSAHAFNSEQRHNLFLAFKEALTNVARHSGATEVHIRIFVENKSLIVAIEDNGHGLPSTVRDSADGLINLRQRLVRIGGSCDITSGKNGVAVRLILPAAPTRRIS